METLDLDVIVDINLLKKKKFCKMIVEKLKELFNFFFTLSITKKYSTVNEEYKNISDQVQQAILTL